MNTSYKKKTDRSHTLLSLVDENLKFLKALLGFHLLKVLIIVPWYLNINKKETCGYGQLSNNIQLQ